MPHFAPNSSYSSCLIILKNWGWFAVEETSLCKVVRKRQQLLLFAFEMFEYELIKVK